MLELDENTSVCLLHQRCFVATLFCAVRHYPDIVLHAATRHVDTPMMLRQAVTCEVCMLFSKAGRLSRLKGFLRTFAAFMATSAPEARAYHAAAMTPATVALRFASMMLMPVTSHHLDPAALWQPSQVASH